MSRSAIFATVLCLAAYGCDQSPTGQDQRDTSEQSQTNSSPQASETEDPHPSWNYSADIDQMRGTKSRFASIESLNELSFGFPYTAGKATLTLRRRPEDGQNVILKVNGQFLCSTFRDDTVAAKFDDGPIRKFQCAEPTDASTGVLFIRNEKTFVSRLKRAKALTIEAEFFQEGRKQMQFDVSGLKWK